MTKRAYTIGHRDSYDLAIAENKPEECTKLGRHGDYAGGGAWRTIEDAQRYLDRDGGTFTVDGRKMKSSVFAIYALELPNGWDQDVEYDEQDGLGRLKVDAKFSALPNPEIERETVLMSFTVWWEAHGGNADMVELEQAYMAGWEEAKKSHVS